MRTLDGEKGSANKLLHILNEQRFKEYTESKQETYINKDIRSEII